ncbi:MAG: hypothetical protein JWL69_690 [Phycisphaerales bacterium]|nr:hypothetical protein [Phycisphaerales bacterium]
MGVDARISALDRRCYLRDRPGREGLFSINGPQPVLPLLSHLRLRPSRDARPLPGMRRGADGSEGECMRRRAFTLLTGLSLLLCVATCGLWLRSYWYQDDVGRHTADRAMWVLLSWRGDLVAFHNTQVGLPRREPFWATYSGPVNDYTFGSVRWSLLGFAIRTSTGTGASENPFTFRTDYFLVPHWFPAALTIILPARQLRILIRRAKRRHSGTCLRCGYDLRATPGRCPECGTIPGPRGNA